MSDKNPYKYNGDTLVINEEANINATKSRKQNLKKYYQGIIDFSNKKDPIISCEKIDHIIKLKTA